MQDIGEKELLVLLLMIQTDLDDRNKLAQVLGRFNQRTDRGIDVRAIRANFGSSRPGDQTALRPRLPRSGLHVIRIEQISESLVKHAIAGSERTKQELLEKPGDVSPMPFGRTRIRHRLDNLIFRG